jgi:hypothetical protein
MENRMKLNNAHELKVEILNKLHFIYLTVGSLKAARSLKELSDECRVDFVHSDRFLEIFPFVLDDLHKQKLIQYYHPNNKPRVFDDKGEIDRTTLLALTHEGVSKCEDLKNTRNMPSGDTIFYKIEGNVSNSTVNFGSNNNVSNSTINEPSIFTEMIQAIESSNLDRQIQIKLFEDVNSLNRSHKNGNFKDGYNKFITSVSDHITIFAPMLASIAALIP